MARRLAWIVFALALTVQLNGCAPVDSFFPLYKPEDKAFEARLVGVWKFADASNTTDKKARWSFRKSEDENFYDFKWGETGAKGGFLAKARLVQMGSALFIDFEGDSENKALDSKNAMIAFPAISVHMIGRIWLEGDRLQIHFLKDSWVSTQIKSSSFLLAYVGGDGNLLLTATTDELRKFMLDHADDDEALSDNYSLVRTK
jgi:hypothetical protein